MHMTLGVIQYTVINNVNTLKQSYSLLSVLVNAIANMKLTMNLLFFC